MSCEIGLERDTIGLIPWDCRRNLPGKEPCAERLDARPSQATLSKGLAAPGQNRLCRGGSILWHPALANRQCTEQARPSYRDRI